MVREKWIWPLCFMCTSISALIRLAVRNEHDLGHVVERRRWYRVTMKRIITCDLQLAQFTV
jgi:hypothetical protein